MYEKSEQKSYFILLLKQEFVEEKTCNIRGKNCVPRLKEKSLNFSVSKMSIDNLVILIVFEVP